MTSSAAKKAPAKPALSNIPTTKPRRWWLWVLLSGGVLFVAVAMVTGIAFAQESGQIVKSSTILGQPVGGNDSLTALTTITKQWETAQKKGLTFQLNNQEYSVPLTGSANEETVILDIVRFVPADAVDRAYAFGHDGPLWKQAWQRLSGWLGRRHEFGRLSISEQDIRDLLQQQLGEFEIAPISAGLEMHDDESFTVTPSTNGTSVQYGEALAVAKRQLRTLALKPILLQMTSVAPAVPTNRELSALAASTASIMLDIAPITLTYEEKTWTIERQQLGKMLGFARSGTTYRLAIDETQGRAYLATIKPEVEIQPKDAKFTLVDGKVKEFQTSQIGKIIDDAATLAELDLALQKKKNTTILVVKEEKPLTDTLGANNLGITELVAEGKTNFRGSPTNRRYNLTYGSQILNGLLLKPGETFSLVSALGAIDGAHGWKPELVIKQGGKITPEFGGGLCQVATTLFRAALNAGLPIVERRNHSLRISYYEPPIGLDATIYEPKPDLRFTNDYAGYLLLQTEVIGDEMTFRFYGTKDGRKVDIPEPKVYNRTGIPATKTIEVTDLKPGEQVCQTPGHPGADATATYTVTKADGTSVTQVFQSHYTAIGVICRVGKAAPKKKTITTSSTVSGSVRQ